MQKPIEFTVAAGPYTNWQIGVVVWPNESALWRAYVKTPPLDKVPAQCRAFCNTLDMDDLGDEDRVLAAIHLQRGDISINLITHEGFHAFSNYIKLTQLKAYSGDSDAEEWAANSIAHIVSEVVAGLKKNKIKVS